MRRASKLVGLSEGYLCKLEAGEKPMSLEMRKRLMVAYGYSPSSFKNLSTDPVRSKAVPLLYKFKILLGRMHENQIESLYYYARDIIAGSVAPDGRLGVTIPFNQAHKAQEAV